MKFLFEQATKSDVKEAVKFIEGTTSAEIVVSVTSTSGTYRDADFLVGFIGCFFFVSLLAFAPDNFPAWTLPLGALLGFAVGVLASSQVWLLRSAVSPRARKLAAVLAAARAYFITQRLSRTKGRSAVLVYVSAFERAVCLVPDLGVPASLEKAFDSARTAMESALAQQDRAAFVTALKSLADPLKGAMPRADDDENELPDAPDEIQPGTKA
jgi:putative membrane protein